MMSGGNNLATKRFWKLHDDFLDKSANHGMARVPTTSFLTDVSMQEYINRYFGIGSTMTFPDDHAEGEYIYGLISLQGDIFLPSFNPFDLDISPLEVFYIEAKLSSRTQGIHLISIGDNSGKEIHAKYWWYLHVFYNTLAKLLEDESFITYLNKYPGYYVHHQDWVKALDLLSKAAFCARYSLEKYRLFLPCKDSRFRLGENI